MDKKFRYILYTVTLIIAVAVAIIRPWQYFSFIPIIGQNAALTVKTIAGKGEVYLDGEKIGETPLSSENLKPGDHEIKIHRVSETENFYQDVVSPIYLEPNTRTFVETEIGPSDQFTSLTILYYQKNKTNKSGLYLDTNPKQSVVWIDEIRQGSSPITSNTLKEGRHEVKITHPGYEDLETTLIIRRGYTLIADIQLMAKPVDTN